MEKTNKAARISPTLTPDLIKRGGKEVSLFAAFLICLRAKFPLFLSLVLLFFYFLISRILIGVMLFLRFREFLLVQLGFDFTYSTFARLHFVFGIYFFRRLLMQIASSTQCFACSKNGNFVQRVRFLRAWQVIITTSFTTVYLVITELQPRI